MGKTEAGEGERDRKTVTETNDEKGETGEPGEPGGVEGEWQTD